MKTLIGFVLTAVVVASILALAVVAATAPSAPPAHTAENRPAAETVAVPVSSPVTTAATAVPAAATEPPAPESLDPAKVERGRYLVATIGCADCHSPKVMGEHGPVFDPDRHLIGHPEGSNLPPA